MTTLNVTTIAAGSEPVDPGASSEAFQPISVTQAIAMMSVNGSAGTIHAVVTDSATAPSAAQVQAGQDHSGSARPVGHYLQSPVAAAGLQVFAPGFSALSGGTTYHGYAVYHNGTSAGAVVYLGQITTPSASGTGTVTISVTKRSTAQVAPECVWFECAVSGGGISDLTALRVVNPAWSDVQYVWDFGDAGARSDKVENLPQAHNDLNKAFGKAVAHVFMDPGTYTVRVTAYNRLTGALIGHDTHTVTMLDADVAAAGNRTIVVDPNSTGLAASYSGSRSAASFVAAMTDLRNESGFNRIVLAEGMDETINASHDVTNTTAQVMVVAEGTGTRPILRHFGTRTEGAIDIARTFTGDLTLVGIQARGNWNTTTETGNSRSNFIDADPGSDFYLAVIDLDAADFGNSAFHINNLANDNNRHAVGVCMYNSRIYGWGNYGTYCDPTPGGYLAFIGNSIKQNVNALNGGEGRPNGSRPHATNMHGPARIADFEALYVAVCDTFSRNGWSEETGGTPSEQPNWRIGYYPNNHGNWSPNYVVERCAMEGGRSVLSVSASVGSRDYYNVNGLVEKCLIIGTCNTVGIFSVQYGGTTIRNCIAVRPEIKSCSDARWRGVFEEPWDNPQRNNTPNEPFQAYGITVINRMTDAQRTSPNTQVRDLDVNENLGDTMNNVTIENLVNWCPNATGQSNVSGPLFDTDRMLTVGGLHTAAYLGRHYQNNSFGSQLTPLDTSFASPTDEVPTGRFGAGSSLIDAVGSDETALDDFYGFPRGANPDMGAVQSIA